MHDVGAAVIIVAGVLQGGGDEGFVRAHADEGGESLHAESVYSGEPLGVFGASPAAWLFFLVDEPVGSD